MDKRTLELYKDVDQKGLNAEEVEHVKGRNKFIDVNSAGRGAKKKPLLPVNEYIKSYTRSRIGRFLNPYRMDSNPDYKAFKELVRRALHGDNLGQYVHEVPFEELDREGVLGKWIERETWISRVTDTPKMFGSKYKSVLKRLRNYGWNVSENELNSYNQIYIWAHEMVEAIVRPKDHDLYEAMLLYAIKELAMGGDPVAQGTYIAGALPVYKMRLDKRDSFIKGISKKYKEVVDDVIGIFGLRPLEPAYA